MFEVKGKIVDNRLIGYNGLYDILINFKNVYILINKLPTSNSLILNPLIFCLKKKKKIS